MLGQALKFKGPGGSTRPAGKAGTVSVRINQTISTTLIKFLEKYPDPDDMARVVRAAMVTEEVAVVTFGGPVKRETRDLFVKTLDLKYAACLQVRDFGVYPGALVSTRGGLN